MSSEPNSERIRLAAACASKVLERKLENHDAQLSSVEREALQPLSTFLASTTWRKLGVSTRDGTRNYQTIAEAVQQIVGHKVSEAVAEEHIEQAWRTLGRATGSEKETPSEKDLRSAISMFNYILKYVGEKPKK